MKGRKKTALEQPFPLPYLRLILEFRECRGGCNKNRTGLKPRCLRADNEKARRQN